MACHTERYTALYLYIMLMLRFITVNKNLWKEFISIVIEKYNKLSIVCNEDAWK